MSRTISITEARKKLFDLAEAVQAPDSYVLLTERGIPKAALISAAHLDSILETLEVIKDFPKIDTDYTDALNDLASGNYWVLNDTGGTNRK